MTTAQIEQQFQFTYPALYRQLAQAGMLDVGEYGPDWQTTVLPRLRHQPTLLLFSDDFELLTLAHAQEVTEALAAPDDYRAIKPEYKFIALGQNGAGDYYCFLPTAQQGPDIPIVFLWHDVDEATFQAKNLQDFIFRRILTDMSNVDENNYDSDQDFREKLTATLGTHEPYLTQEQAAILRRILERAILPYEVQVYKTVETRRGLLTADELVATLAAVIPFDKLDVSFAYSAE